MMKYIALLRGINISGKNKISMNELRSELQKYKYQNISTYLNSGNVIFESEIDHKESIMQDIYKIIKDKFHLEIPVFIMTASELKDILVNAPDWWGTDNKEIYDNLIFIIPPVTYDDVYSVLGNPNEYEKIQEYKNYIFWSYRLKDYRKTNWWSRTASTDIRYSITIRTATTTRKILEICNR